MNTKIRKALSKIYPVFFTASQVVEEYNRREHEIKNLEKELDDKSNALNAYRQNISEVRQHLSAVCPL